MKNLGASVNAWQRSLDPDSDPRWHRSAILMACVDSGGSDKEIVQRFALPTPPRRSGSFVLHPIAGLRSTPLSMGRRSSRERTRGPGNRLLRGAARGSEGHPVVDDLVVN